MTRPTTDFVRQALFSILGERVEGARVLDLFAGSGAMGLEALSRGAASCVFVDENRAAERVLKGNLAKSRLDGGRVVLAEAHAWIRRDRGEYDLVVVDPPYAKTALDRDHLAELLGKGVLAESLSPDGILVLEQSSAEASREGAGLELLERREYGSSAILLYRRQEGS